LVIALRLVRRSDGAEPGQTNCPVAAGGSTIGRAPDCDLVLDDPQCLVSRRHAWLVPRGADQALLRCISSTAALLVNGEALPPGGERLVRTGDRLRIGGFELLLEPGAAVVAPPAARPAQPCTPRLDQWFELDTVADPLGPGSPLPALDRAALPEPTRRVVRSEPALVDRDALRRAFLRGAGLDPATPFMPGPLEMEHLGQLLRAATEGMLGLLRSRAAAESGRHDDGTRVVARENNPLKFVPDAEQALQLLLDMHGRPGFLDPVDAVRDAHDESQILDSSFGREFLRACEAPLRGLRR
jgi:predicted component of type VI protein secretion system